MPGSCSGIHPASNAPACRIRQSGPALPRFLPGRTASGSVVSGLLAMGRPRDSGDGSTAGLWRWVDRGSLATGRPRDSGDGSTGGTLGDGSTAGSGDRSTAEPGNGSTAGAGGPVRPREVNRASTLCDDDVFRMVHAILGVRRPAPATGTDSHGRMDHPEDRAYAAMVAQRLTGQQRGGSGKDKQGSRPGETKVACA
jgi:hypothetical protein